MLTPKLSKFTTFENAILPFIYHKLYFFQECPSTGYSGKSLSCLFPLISLLDFDDICFRVSFIQLT